MPVRQPAIGYKNGILSMAINLLSANSMTGIIFHHKYCINITAEKIASAYKLLIDSEAEMNVYGSHTLLNINSKKNVIIFYIQN